LETLSTVPHPKKKANDCIHIRPSLTTVDEAKDMCDNNPLMTSHIVMLSMRNFLVIMHNPAHQCFVCREIHQTGDVEKYIY
jgi:hypothetical protein